MRTSPDPATPRLAAPLQFGERRPTQATGQVHLLDAVPELAEDLRPAEAAEARRALTVRAIGLAPGPWRPLELGQDAFGAVVLEGLAVGTSRRFGCDTSQLVGPGDVVDPATLTGPGTRWRGLEAGRLALLDARFVLAARRWPGLMTALARRLFEGQQEQRILAEIVRMRRVEDRLLALICHLGSRWGRVGPDGVAVSLPVTHGVLGGLVGAQRPTVSLALTTLHEQGLLRRRDDGCWLLRADCQEWAVDGIPSSARPRAVDAAA